MTNRYPQKSFENVISLSVARQKQKKLTFITGMWVVHKYY